MRRNRTTMPPKKKLKTTCEQYLEEIERIRERTMHSRTKRPLSGRDVTELQKALFYGCCTKNVKILTDIVDFAIEKNHFNIMWFKGLKEEQIYEICGQKFALSEKDYVLDLCILNHWPNDKLFAVLEAYEKLDAEGRMFFTKTGPISPAMSSKREGQLENIINWMEMKGYIRYHVDEIVESLLLRDPRSTLLARPLIKYLFIEKGAGPPSSRNDDIILHILTCVKLDASIDGDMIETLINWITATDKVKEVMQRSSFFPSLAACESQTDLPAAFQRFWQLVQDRVGDSGMTFIMGCCYPRRLFDIIFANPNFKDLAFVLDTLHKFDAKDTFVFVSEKPLVTAFVNDNERLMDAVLGWQKARDLPLSLTDITFALKGHGFGFMQARVTERDKAKCKFLAAVTNYIKGFPEVTKDIERLIMDSLWLAAHNPTVLLELLRKIPLSSLWKISETRLFYHLATQCYEKSFWQCWDLLVERLGAEGARATLISDVSIIRRLLDICLTNTRWSDISRLLTLYHEMSPSQKKYFSRGPVYIVSGDSSLTTNDRLTKVLRWYKRRSIQIPAEEVQKALRVCRTNAHILCLLDSQGASALCTKRNPTHEDPPIIWWLCQRDDAGLLEAVLGWVKKYNVKLTYKHIGQSFLDVCDPNKHNNPYLLTKLLSCPAYVKAFLQEIAPPNRALLKKSIIAKHRSAVLLGILACRNKDYSLYHPFDLGPNVWYQSEFAREATQAGMPAIRELSHYKNVKPPSDFPRYHTRTFPSDSRYDSRYVLNSLQIITQPQNADFNLFKDTNLLKLPEITQNDPDQVKPLSCVWKAIKEIGCFRDVMLGKYNRKLTEVSSNLLGLNTPLSLKQLCRQAVRSRLSDLTVLHTPYTLQLPTTLQDYVALKSLDDMAKHCTDETCNEFRFLRRRSVLDQDDDPDSDGDSIESWEESSFEDSSSDLDSWGSDIEEDWDSDWSGVCNIM